MANQGSDRRTVLAMLAKAVAASQFPGFSRWAFGRQHEHGSSAALAPRAANYQPSYFSASEYRTIDILPGYAAPGETVAINLPGTDRERPNWRRRLDPDVSELCRSPLARAILAALGARAA